MDIEQLRNNAPKGACYWSPVVEQYFDYRFMSLSPAFKGRYIQVGIEFRGDLVSIVEGESV